MAEICKIFFVVVKDPVNVASSLASLRGADAARAARRGALVVSAVRSLAEETLLGRVGGADDRGVVGEA
jgi:hypothetical protein